MLTAIILVKNEEVHIQRCINSLTSLCDQVIVVDSGSTDATLEICRNYSVEVLQNQWINYATQFNWALDNANIRNEWVFRIDADEYVDDELRKEIAIFLGNHQDNKDVVGVRVLRPTVFMDRRLSFSDGYKTTILRLFRHRLGRCESRWMDEHIIVEDGKIITLRGCLVDDNISGLSQWISKHNKYATREAIDILMNVDYPSFLDIFNNSSAEKVKRYIKIRIYNQMPLFLRSFLYFLYRYIFKLGFLDGAQGLAYTFMQGLWYRWLVDLKVKEIYALSKSSSISLEQAISHTIKRDL